MRSQKVQGMWFEIPSLVAWMFDKNEFCNKRQRFWIAEVWVVHIFVVKAGAYWGNRDCSKLLVARLYCMRYFLALIAIGFPCVQGRNEGNKGEKCSGRQINIGAPKIPSNVASTFFNTAHLLLKDLRFEHGVAKLVSCHGRHLTSVRPCLCSLLATN